MASLARIPILGDLLRSLGTERPDLTIDVGGARAGDSLPAIRVTLVNPGETDLFLESVGMVFVDGSAFGDWVGVELPRHGGSHVSWFRLIDLEARIGHRDPASGLEEVFGATSSGTRKLRVDRRRLHAELASLQPAVTGP